MCPLVLGRLTILVLCYSIGWLTKVGGSVKLSPMGLNILFSQCGHRLDVIRLPLFQE